MSVVDCQFLKVCIHKLRKRRYVYHTQRYLFLCVIVDEKKNCKMDEVERIKALKAKGKMISMQK